MVKLAPKAAAVPSFGFELANGFRFPDRPSGVTLTTSGAIPSGAPQRNQDFSRKESHTFPKTFEEFDVRFTGAIRNMVQKAISSHHDGEDLIQEISLKVWQNRHKYNPQKAALITYVMLQTRSAIVDSFRRAGAREKRLGKGVSLDEQFLPTPDRPTPCTDEVLEVRRRLYKAIERLPEVQRTVVEFRLAPESPALSKIAEITGWPLGTVKSALSRALSSLRKDKTLEALVLDRM